MQAVRVFALAVGTVADPSRHGDTGDGHDGACLVSRYFLFQVLSSLTGQCEDEPHPIHNSSRHGGCINSVSLEVRCRGEEERGRNFLSDRWRNARSCGVFDTEGCAIRCEACSVQARGSRRRYKGLQACRRSLRRRHQRIDTEGKEMRSQVNVLTGDSLFEGRRGERIEPGLQVGQVRTPWA